MSKKKERKKREKNIERKGKHEVAGERKRKMDLRLRCNCALPTKGGP